MVFDKLRELFEDSAHCLHLCQKPRERKPDYNENVDALKVELKDQQTLI